MKKHRHRQRKPRIANAAPAERPSDEPVDGDAFYHGGAPGVGVGDYLLPRSLTGDAGSRAEWPDEWVKAAGVEDLEDGDWVFYTRNFKLAARCAVVHRSGHGRVYEVVPEGKIEADPARVQDCFRCSRAKVVAIKAIPDAFAQRIRAENPRNFEEAASNFEKTVDDGAKTIRRAQDDAVSAGQELVRQKVAEICATDLSSQFIATELFAHALRLMVPDCDMWLARALAARHWETVLSTLPAQMRA
jgi:hypothetical protein